jgi:superfamily II DNA/RNA helicase
MIKQDEFVGMDLDPRLLAAIRDEGFTTPTAVQRAAIPAAVAGRDVLGCAATGSGKTAAFALPILQRLLSRPRGRRARWCWSRRGSWRRRLRSTRGRWRRTRT